ncbi:nucleolar protein 12-like [Miscanthus floridulus]|uniref:nucleolar protein 12-like n=1 Tax=Miscanthus floridulus TaxID=154761 RepID=UPI00345ACBAA
MKGVDKDEKEDEDKKKKKKKSVAFKASSSSRNKGKCKKQESSDDEDASDIDNESMALFVRKMGKFMKKGYDDDDSSDDNKKSPKKALVSIAINNKPSIFDTPLTCLMAKPTKIKYDVSHNNDCESDDCRSDEEEEEYTKEELMDMLEQVHTCFEMERNECKELRKRVKSLE